MERLQHALKHAAKMKLKRENQEQPGFVYLIQCHDFIKVGIAVDVATRLLTLQTGNPYELKLLGSFAVSNMKTSETKLHALWQRYEVRGEWFLVPAGELASAMSASCFDDIFQ